MRLRYFHREIKVATSSYDSGAQPWRVGNAWIGSYENPIFPTIRSIFRSSVGPYKPLPCLHTHKRAWHPQREARAAHRLFRCPLPSPTHPPAAARFTSFIGSKRAATPPGLRDVQLERRNVNSYWLSFRPSSLWSNNL